MKRDKIILMPYSYMGTASNKIIANIATILSEKYEIIGQMSPSHNPISMLETKAIILNWNEQNITEDQKEQILKYQEYGAKIIWFFHNRVSHEVENRSKENANMVWLADHSDYIGILSKTSKQYVPGKKENKDKVCYVPHVKYPSHKNERIMQELRKKYCIQSDDFVYCMYGGIRPYKNIEKAIRCFKNICQEKMKLLIVGNPFPQVYGSEILKLTEKDENIVTEFKILTDTELDSIIGISDVILMTHTGLSSMNSGVLIKAFCEGKTVITPEICMVQDIPSEENFLYRYVSDKCEIISEQMLKAYEDGKNEVQKKGQLASEYIDKWNNDENVKAALDHMLDNDREEVFMERCRVSQTDKLIYDLETSDRYHNNELKKYYYLFEVMCQWMRLKSKEVEVADWVKNVGWKKIAIYGLGQMGQALQSDLRKQGVDVVYGIDRNAAIMYADIPIYTLDELPEPVDGIIVTAVTCFDEISKKVREQVNIPVVSFKDILDELDYLHA